jgi:hypothetical protein
MPQELITSATLKQLAEAGSIEKAVVSPVEDGFAVSVNFGVAQSMVQAKRGHVRKWKTIDAAARTLHLLGLKLIEIDLSTFDAKTPEASATGGHTTRGRSRNLDTKPRPIFGGVSHD